MVTVKDPNGVIKAEVIMDKNHLVTIIFSKNATKKDVVDIINKVSDVLTITAPMALVKLSFEPGSEVNESNIEEIMGSIGTSAAKIGSLKPCDELAAMPAISHAIN